MIPCSSASTGGHLYRQCAPTIKKLGLELGGNAPFIVDDADLNAAVEGAPIFPEVGAADKTVAFQ
ncbi:aldehyde dehydrogenase family protein [Agrobacterium tumefaciens]|nr:aldehyde dehydrogenase family protein [Agrobacterium tumefaciens]